MAGYEGQAGSLRTHCDGEWDASVMPTLEEYIKVDNQSPSYDSEERTNGKTEKAMALIVDWVKAAGLEGAEVLLMEEPGRTPFLLVDVQPANGGEAKDTLLMYGHMDKQPPMDDVPPGWSEGLGPYKPVVRDGKLYGRGGADDGYAAFAAVLAVRALQKHKLAHGHIAIVIEACEESGSFDLPFYLEKIKNRICNVDLVVCLDSGALAYDTMYATTSLRGVCGGTLSVSLMKEGMHSGMGGGIAPDPFRVARILLNRLEDPETGALKLDALYCDVPPEVAAAFAALNEGEAKLISGSMPLLDGVQLDGTEAELALRNTWKPCLTVTGLDGLPSCAQAGNVLRKGLSFQLSIRLPALVNPDVAIAAVKKELERDPPYGARVTFEPEFSGAGWAAPPMRPWCRRLLDTACKTGFARPLGLMGVGGSIPFMGMLGEMYPQAQFCITGLLGPKSNAHGPDEFLHIGYAKNLVMALTRIVHGHAADPRD